MGIRGLETLFCSLRVPTLAGATPESPRGAPFHPTSPRHDSRGEVGKITPTIISKTLKTTVGFYEPNLGFESKDVSAHSLCTAGAMALICSGEDSDIIKLIGCWRSNKMFRYIHVQAEPLMRNFSRVMLTHGNYSILPHQEEVPCF